MAEHFDYLIIGGGMVADSAARGIRSHDRDGTIGILSLDVDEPYTRPALTKKLWTDPDFGWDKVPLNTARDTGAVITLETRVTRLDPTQKTVTTDAGDEFDYGKLLLATGGSPKRVDIPDDERVIYFRSAEDYRRLRALADRHAHAAVIGGSFIGTELAAALVQNGCDATLVYPEAVLGGSVFPQSLAEAFQDMFAAHGVILKPNSIVSRGSVDERGITVHLEDGTRFIVDAAVFGLGVEPVTDLAVDAGLKVEDGVVVDETLRTSEPDVYAAGDVASYPDVILGRRRIEHVDNARAMGETAGQIMAGSAHSYTHTPYFYSVVFEASYEAVGTVDASLETLEVWTEPNKKGVVYYLDDGVVAGVLLWNVPGKLDAARRVLASAHALTRDDLAELIVPDA